MKKRRNFREGNYAISVNLVNPGDEFQEFLKVRVTEDGKVVAKAIFKQWAGKARWEPLSVTVENPAQRISLREMIYNAATNAVFFIKD